MTHRNNVLRVNSREETEALRRAVSRIICDIQRDNGLTDIDLAEAIDVSVGTISNARNMRNDLNAVYLARLGKRFGPASLDPYHALYEGRGVPLEASCDTDALPSTAAAVHKLAVVMAPDSPGGIAITHGELLDILPDIKAALRALSVLEQRAEQIRSAA